MASTSEGRPNVLIIQADQFRWDCLGAAGNPDVHTPHLDQLAADGARFENAFCPFPVCTPSRYSMLSGLYVHEHGGWTNRSTLPSSVQMFPAMLREAGYRTAAVGKMHFTPTYLDVGYDRMELAEQDGPGRWEDAYHRELAAAGLEATTDLTDQEAEWRAQAPAEYWERYGAGPSNLPEKWHSTTWIGRRSMEVLDDWTDDASHLLHVSFVKPHHPFDPPQRWVERYDPAALTLLPGWTSAIPAADQQYLHEYFDYSTLTSDTLRHVMAHYYATITQLDHHVGVLLDALRARGLYDRTLIIFTSDHGEYLGFHHLLLKDGPMYDPLVRVPLIVKFPDGMRDGVAADALVSLVDVAPTVLAAAGCEPLPDRPGVDLAAPGAGHDVVFAEDRRHGDAYMLRSADHKLVKSGKAEREMFFDLRNDPLELNAISDDHEQVRAWRDSNPRPTA